MEEEKCEDASKGLHITQLPKYFLLDVLSYLTPQEILGKVQCVNGYFKQLVSQPLLWQTLDKYSDLPIKYKYKIIDRIVERRSKGMLFVAESRYDKSLVTMRRVNVAVANAAMDDGVPTSLLREISTLKSLNCKNIT